MRDKISLKWMMAIFLIMLNIKCSEKTNPIRFEPPEPPTFSFRTIPVPEKMVQSADSMAQRTVKYISLVNSVSDYEIYINPPDTIKLQFQGENVYKPVWTGTWDVDSLTIELTFSTINNYREWDVEFTGVKNGKIYTGSDAIMVTQEIDQGTVMIHLFDIEPLDFASWFCRTDYNGSYTVSMSASEELILRNKIVVSEMPDGSGELIIWRNEGTQKFKAKWKPDGTGQWWTYDMNGQTAATGIWN